MIDYIYLLVNWIILHCKFYYFVDGFFIMFFVIPSIGLFEKQIEIGQNAFLYNFIFL